VARLEKKERKNRKEKANIQLSLVLETWGGGGGGPAGEMVGGPNRHKPGGGGMG
jgi:hypothetical protein